MHTATAAPDLTAIGLDMVLRALGHPAPTPAVIDTTDPLASIREADGPDEEAPVTARPIIHVIGKATTDTMYGRGATVGEIIDRANALRAQGHATALRWVRDTDRRIIGVELSTYEAR